MAMEELRCGRKLMPQRTLLALLIREHLRS